MSKIEVSLDIKPWTIQRALTEINNNISGLRHQLQTDRLLSFVNPDRNASGSQQMNNPARGLDTDRHVGPYSFSEPSENLPRRDIICKLEELISVVKCSHGFSPSAGDGNSVCLSNTSVGEQEGGGSANPTPTPTPTTFYITFGVKYNHMKHESGYPVTGEGWCEISGSINEEQARRAATGLFHGQYAFLYTEENFQPYLYLKGCQLRITIKEES